MTNIVGQLFKSLDPWPGFQITSFKIQVSPVDGRKTLILDLRPVEQCQYVRAAAMRHRSFTAMFPEESRSAPF